MELTDIAQYPRTSLVNDRKNNRVKGRELPKHIKTVDQRGCACWFEFILKCNINVVFYIELRQQSGHAFHVFHSKIIDPSLVALPMHLLTSDEIDKLTTLLTLSTQHQTMDLDAILFMGNLANSSV